MVWAYGAKRDLIYGSLNKVLNRYYKQRNATCEELEIVSALAIKKTLIA